MLQASIIGNLGRSAETVTLNDRDFYKFSVAHENRKGETLWVSVLYRGSSEKLADLLVKGAKVYASGRLNVTTYQAKDGGIRPDVTLYADTLEIVKYADAPAAAAPAYGAPEYNPLGL